MLSIKRIRGFAKRISEGEIPVEELKQTKLWDRWVRSCNDAIRDTASRLDCSLTDIHDDHPVVRLAYRVKSVELFADESY